jgi:16S rRNA (uracil1498-N3)-methyltransferase
LALPPKCVNSGGLKSLILLENPVELECAVPLSQAAIQSLRIWQARSGEVMTVVDPEGVSYRARLQGLDSESPVCIPFERLLVSRESALELVVFQSLPGKERFEIILQKLTELGVSRMVPMETVHSTTVRERDAGQKNRTVGQMSFLERPARVAGPCFQN